MENVCVVGSAFDPYVENWKFISTEEKMYLLCKNAKKFKMMIIKIINKHNNQNKTLNETELSKSIWHKDSGLYLISELDRKGL